MTEEINSYWKPWPDLQAMWDHAVKEGLWFYCSYQQIWISPTGIRTEWDNGRMRWGAVNWELRKRGKKQ